MSLKSIKLLLLDVDGVLTDGTLWFSPEGETVKSFYVRDGLGLVMLQKKGIRVGVITGRHSPALLKRLEDLKINLVYQGIPDKIVAYEEILRKENLTDKEVAYMGDDVPDLTLLKRVGFAAAPADAIPEVKKIVHFVTSENGGRGAVRALVEAILKAQGKWDYGNG